MAVRHEHDPGPAELVMAAAAARRFYLDGRSKVEIGDELGLSRFKVARLLDTARSRGIVQIRIALPAEVDGELSERLRRRFGLRHAIVVATDEEDEASLRGAVGRVGAELLAELAVPDDVVGIAWGRSLHALTRALSTLPPCTVVQLCGALVRADIDEGSVELVRQVAAVSRGRSHTFYAPLIVPDASTAAALRGGPGISDALRAMDDLTVAVVSIGAWYDSGSTVFDALSADERRSLAAAGVVAETCGITYDHDGTVSAALAGRTVGVSAEQLRRTPEVIALAYGTNKADAVRAVLSSGIISSVVTHASLAHALLRTGGTSGDVPPVAL